MLLEDVFIIENLQVLNEGKTGPMKIRGVFQRADEENNNKRIYPKKLLDREIQKLKESMDGRRLMGELDHPQHDSVKLSNVSHLITKLEAQGNEIIGEAEILDTPMGKVAKALIEGGVQIGISSRGMGTLSEGQDGKRYVNEDFRLITWDLVADPSTRGAFPTLAESKDVNSMLVEEILSDVLPRVTKQKVFSTLLSEALKGKQHKLDKNKNGKIDGEDFKMLRGKRTDEALPLVAALAGRALASKAGRSVARKAGAAAAEKGAGMLSNKLSNKNGASREDASTLFARVGSILAERRAAAKRVGEIGDDDKPTGTSYVSGGRTGQMSGYGKKGGRLLGKDGKPHAFAKEALKRFTQVDSKGKIPKPKK
jgi:hypothetical protein